MTTGFDTGPPPPAGAALRPVTGRSVLAVLALWAVSSALLGTAAFLVADRLTGSDAEAPTLAAVLVVFLLLPVAAWIVYRTAGLRDQLAVRPVGVPALALGVCVWLAALAASAVVCLLLGLATGDPLGPASDVIRDATDMARFPEATTLDWALIVPRAILLAGIAEEVLYRGILYGWLAQHLPTWPVILITAALFALEHSYFPLLIPLGLIFGVAAGWLRARTGSILPGLLVHVLTDASLFILALTATAQSHAP